MNTAALELDWTEAFEGGAIRRRELRLTQCEALHLRETGAQVTELAPSGNKFWYEVVFAREG